MIGGVAPSQYLQKIQHHRQVQLSDGEMDRIVESHLIPADYLRRDHFDNFYEARKTALLSLIERVMGKQLLTGQMPEEADEDEETELTAAA
jgi:hypothetical protein